MISMEMMGKIRRMYFRDKLSLHEIAKRTGLARNTIRKWVRVRIPRHSDTQPTLIRTPVPRSFGQAVGAQRRRFALLV